MPPLKGMCSAWWAAIHPFNMLVNGSSSVQIEGTQENQVWKSQTVDSFPWWASPGICTNYFWGDLLMHHSPSSPCGDNGMLWHWKDTTTHSNSSVRKLAFRFVWSNHLQLFCLDAADQPHMDSGCPEDFPSLGSLFLLLAHQTFRKMFFLSSILILLLARA